MTNFVIGSDNIDKKEKTYISQMSKILKKKGHSVKSVGVGPGHVQSYGLTSGAKNKTAIFIVGGSDGGTYSDFVHTNYKYDFVWFAFTSWIGNSWITCNGLKTKKLVRAHDDNFSSAAAVREFTKYTADGFFKKYSKKIGYVCGDDIKTLADGILNKTTDNSSNNSDKSTSKSYRDIIKDLIAPLDGNVEVRIENDTVYISKIDTPEPSVYVMEGHNLVSGQLSITDYNPTTINKLTITYGKKKLVISDDYLIDRFGEMKSSKEAKYTVTTYSSTDEKEDSDNIDKKSSKSKEVKITSKKEALAFAKREWGKIRRNDGHTIECQVLGYNDFKTGIWCNIWIPTFNESLDMYITKVSHSVGADSEWLTNLTLKDYPPSLSSGSETTTPT